ncbi:C40 family peptidase [Cellulomonas hominis]
MTTGITTVLARMTELRQLVEPATTSSSAASAASTAGAGTSFASTLAALGLDPSGLDLSGLWGPSGASAATATAGSIAPAGSTATGQSLVAAATKYLGVPYVWGGESLDEGGLDCSGLVLRSLADIGVTDVPRVAKDQMTLGTEVASLDQALPGDLVVFHGGTHIGIYVGDGKMIDAPKPGGSVTVRDVYTEPTTIRRILPQAASATSAASAQTVASTTASATASAQRAALELLSGLSAGTTTTGSTATAGTAGLLATLLGLSA